MSAVAKPVILLVDDDPGDQELTRRALAEGPVTVDLRIVDNGEQALDYLFHRHSYSAPNSSPHPDLVLLDLNMPRVDGRQVLQRMRAHEDLCRIPVVVLTTSRQDEDILQSYELGCNTFVKKPVEVDDFVQAIRQLGLYWFTIAQLPSR